MVKHGRTRVARRCVALVVAAAGVYLMVLVIAGASISTVRAHALPLLIVVLLAAFVALGGWRRAQAAAGALLGAETDTRAALGAELSRERTERERVEESATRLREEQERRLADAARQLEDERKGRRRSEKERRVEREWNRELRTQIVRMHREGGVLGKADDIPALVLHIAVTLLDAQKGLLLSRSDRDGDGTLDLAAAEGFDADPSESALAQRFASEVIDRDTTIREDDPDAIGGERHNAADEEIRNLVAIPIYVQDEFSGVVVCANREGGFHEHDDEVLLALGDHAGAILENSHLHGQLRGAYVSTVRVLAAAIEAKDPVLRGHSEEVSRYVAAVAERFGIDAREREELVFGSLLHDVGKIGISERILFKPAKLTDEERRVVELHPRIGARLVEQVPALQPAARAILHHHERFDGDGYPQGLSGNEIPLESRIICVADSFSAMTADRPYRGRMSIQQACEELERCAGTQFDPEVVEAFVEQVKREPPPDDENVLEAALRDDELDSHREGDEPVLGFGALETTDNLTLLHSHRHFHEMVEQLAADEEPFAVLIAELLDLAQLNQVEGYDAGDEAIKSAARALERVAVRYGASCARYSGRRLAVLLPTSGAASAADLAAAITKAVVPGPRIALGTAEWRPGDSGFDVIARARLALQPAVVPG